MPAFINTLFVAMNPHFSSFATAAVLYLLLPLPFMCKFLERGQEVSRHLLFQDCETLKLGDCFTRNPPTSFAAVLPRTHAGHADSKMELLRGGPSAF